MTHMSVKSWREQWVVLTPLSIEDSVKSFLFVSAQLKLAASFNWFIKNVEENDTKSTFLYLSPGGVHTSHWCSFSVSDWFKRRIRDTKLFFSQETKLFSRQKPNKVGRGCWKHQCWGGCSTLHWQEGAPVGVKCCFECWMLQILSSEQFVHSPSFFWASG